MGVSPDAHEYVYTNIGFPNPVQSSSVEYVYENTGAEQILVADTAEYVYGNTHIPAPVSVFPFARTHVYLPMVTPAGDLLSYADVSFIDVDTGLLSTAPLYRTHEPSGESLTNPVTFVPGIIDIWCDDPARFNLLVRGANNYSNYLYGVDLMPSPESIARTTVYTEIENQSAINQVMLSDGTSQYWDLPVLIAAHDHDGYADYSTRLGVNSNTSEDNDYGQTWIGDSSTVAAIPQPIYIAALGAQSTPSTSPTAQGLDTLLGANTSVRNDGHHSVAIGNGASADQYSISIGADTGEDGTYSITMPHSAVDPDFYVHTADINLRNASVAASPIEIGNAVAVPAVPVDVTDPFWVRGDLAIPGTLVADGPAQVPEAAGLLGFFDQPGAVKTTIASTATGAMASLLSKLDRYGLMTVNRSITWSGYDWAVRAKIQTEYPGPNSWSDDPEYSWVDPDTGQLVVAIKQDGSRWNCVELEGPHLGYGKYSFVLATNPAAMDIKPVLGLFTYDDSDDGTYAYREIDMEVTKWNYAPEKSRMWYTVQGSGGWSEERRSDHGMDTAVPYVCEFTWQAGQVYFRTLDDNGVLLGEHLVTEDVFAPGAETIRINLWLADGDAPVDGLPYEVRLDSFTFTSGTTYTPPAASAQVSTFSGPGMSGIALKDGVTMVGDVLTIECTGPSYSTSFTGSVYDLTGSSVDVSIIGVPAIGTGTTESIWYLRFDSENYFGWFVSGGDLYTVVMQGGSSATSNVGAYDPVAHQYLRIREAAGTVYFDSAPDRATWTNDHSSVHTLGAKILSMRCWFECGYFGTETSPLPLEIDSINTT